MLTIQFCASSLEDLAWALAEGDHDFGSDYIIAGYSLIMWPDHTTFN